MALTKLNNQSIATLTDFNLSTDDLPAGAVLQVQQTSSGTRVSQTTTSYTEPSTSYRVVITPTRSNSMICLQYYIPLNQNSASNVLTIMRAFRSVGGSKSYDLTSRGSSNGNRNVIAGGLFRPGNGFDYNDHNMITFNAVDFPNTTSTCEYGFETRPEGANTTSFGYSQSNSGIWGIDADIVIIATEIAQ